MPQEKKYRTTKEHPAFKEGYELTFEQKNIWCIDSDELQRNPTWYEEVKEYPKEGTSVFFVFIHFFGTGDLQIDHTFWVDNQINRKAFDNGFIYTKKIDAQEAADKIKYALMEDSKKFKL